MDLSPRDLNLIRRALEHFRISGLAYNSSDYDRASELLEEVGCELSAFLKHEGEVKGG